MKILTKRRKSVRETILLIALSEKEALIKNEYTADEVPQ